MTKINPFHLAVPVSNLEDARSFYRDVLGCEEGRSSEHWVDFNLFGHQFVIHYKPPKEQETAVHHNPVDGHDVPVPHFGVVLDWEDFHGLASDLKSHGIQFIIEPYIRFKGQVGEQANKLNMVIGIFFMHFSEWERVILANQTGFM